MSDLPDLDYTVNDPSSVECPYCHETMEFDEQMVGEMSDFDDGASMDCHHCSKPLVIRIQIEAIVQAWKKEATR